MDLRLIVNGEEVTIADCRPATSLAAVLRDYLNLTGTKRGCDSGGCGMCTVLLDGKTIYSCMTPCWKAEGKRVITIEGMTSEGEAPDPLQVAFSKNYASQCGYCTGAMLLAGKSFLENFVAIRGREDDGTVERNELDVDREIKEALCGILCRCTGYLPYIYSIREVAIRINKP